MITLTFPDGAAAPVRARHHRPRGRRGHRQVARQAHRRDGARRRPSLTLPTRSRATPGSSSCRREDPRALELIRHDCAHVLAEAVQDALPGHPGHHRPGDRERLLLRLRAPRALHPRGFPGDRGEDARDHRPRQTLHQGGLEPRQGQAGVRRQGRGLQGRARRRHPGGPGSQDLRPGRLVRPLPRPAHDLDGQGRHRLQAHEGGRRLLARRLEQPDADPHLRHGLGDQEDLDAYLKQLEEAEKRDHRRLGREMDLFHFQEEAPGTVFWHPQGLDPVPEPHRLHAPAPEGPTTRRSTRRRSSTSRSGRPPAIGAGTRRTCSSPRRRTSASSRSSP